jgi:hypothetical protein
LSEQAWIQAINNGTYPMEGNVRAAYEANAKDLGRCLLGAAPLESRAGAVIPPSALSGNRYGDYLTLRTSAQGIWDFGLTMNQFTRAGEQQVQVQAKIEKGSVYPLWVSNGTATPMGGRGGNTGLPGLLEIQAGPAFWIKLDQAEPVFYPAGTRLKLGPLSDKLGIGAARVVAVAPDGAQTFQANLSLADLSGDWSTQLDQLNYTVIDCEGSSGGEETRSSPDTILQLFSGSGTYVKSGTDPASLNLVWQGTLPEGMTGSSEVTVEVDKVRLHYRVVLPQPPRGGDSRWLTGVTPGRVPDAVSLQSHGVQSSVWPALPLLGALAWRQRRRKWIGRAGLLVLGAFALSGCGLSVWGTIDATYTFNKLEYIDSPPAAGGATSGQAEPAVTWKLSNGQVVFDLDLKIDVETTDSEGKPTVTTSPCKMTVTGSAAGTVGPADSVSPPESSN